MSDTPAAHSSRAIHLLDLPPSDPLAGRRALPLTALQVEILDVLQSSPDPLSTTEIRHRANCARRPRPGLVAEQVYRCLLALHRRDLVTRVPAERIAIWQPAGSAEAITHKPPERRSDAS
ncbi:hypothetical protein [Mycolicibacterium mageritense]|uniref:hypothetical protein n=1 Tax=Mycolicibacterium mageritense TaxID=53462 RepID=UPI001E2AF33A|nr:hypothetical protein [Mycolicibacterium mageritense]MCC9186952.1 hypothetical protein [Mycolicibacterium mageritense]